MKKNRWDDHYTRRAREENWRARSVYKLQEIDKKYKIVSPGNRVLDIGCCPGSWSQYVLKKMGSKGEVVGIDLAPTEELSAPNFRLLQADVLSLDLEELTSNVGPCDVVLSDLAPATTGVPLTDASRSLTLAERALEMVLALLKEKGHFVCKVFEGQDFPAFKRKVAAYFETTKVFRPKATRKRSREAYVVGRAFQGRG